MKKLKVILSIVMIVVLVPILFISGVILVNSYTKPNEIPSFFGYKPFIVLSGSMKDEINSGDLVLTKECNVDDLKKGDIISFKEDEIVITHRIIDITENNGEKRFITKGDNNENEDPGYVSSDISSFWAGDLSNSPPTQLTAENP